jgi:predicted negative regulator of RcsB-dependent stress response
MNDYMTEKEQIQKIREWWNQSGKWIAVMVLVGLMLGAGYRYWKRYELKKTEAASQLYELTMMTRAKKMPDLEQQYVKQLKESESKSVYATFASLQMAQDDVVAKRLQPAYQNLSWVVQHAPTASLRQLARIRSARVLLAMKQYKRAHTVLATVDDKGFIAMVNDVQGNIYLAEGNATAAMAAYQKAKAAYAAAGESNPILLMQMSSMPSS